MFMQILAAGTTMGLVYAVIAFGFQVVARGSNIFNFAHGEFVAVATLIYFSFAATLHVFPVAAIALTVAAVMLVSVAVERLMLAPARVRDPLILAILTVGIGTLMRGIMILAWGHDVLFAPPLLTGPPFSWGGASIGRANVVLVAACVLVVAGLYLVFARTLWGKKILAAAINPEAARLVGVEDGMTRLSVFLLAGFMAGIAGALVAPVTFASSGSGFQFVLKAFAAALLGGLDRFAGPLVGGLVLGWLEAFTAGYVSSAYREPVVLAFVIVALMVRPSGLLGAPAERVT
jgi:branched-chain amino acid transport system permease protein